MFRSLVCLLALASVFPAAKADLLAVRPGFGTSQPAILGFQEKTGAANGAFSGQASTEGYYGTDYGPDGNLYVASNLMGYGAVLRFDGKTGAFLDSFVPYYSQGLVAPTSLHFGADKTLFVASLGGAGFGANQSSIYKFAPTGAFLGTIPLGIHPYDFVMVSNHFYVVGRLSDQPGHPAAVTEYDSLGTVVRTFDTNYVAEPGGITLAPDGTLLVTDTFNDSIVRFKTDGTYLETILAAGPAGLNRPGPISVGPDALLYVGNGGNHSVARFTPQGQFVDLFVAPGSGGLTTGPSALAFSPRAPKLKFERGSKGLRLCWSVTPGNYVIESRARGNEAWSVVQRSTCSSELLITNSSSVAFYRMLPLWDK